MLSIISVYNNVEKLQSRLVASLDRQTVSAERILIDNRDRRFVSAAQALNWGAAQAKGDWLVFVHQDIEFLQDHWLEQCEHLLKQVDPKGWHGLVGRTASGVWQGLIRDRAMVSGTPFDQPIPVQTLDEILLIHRRWEQTKPYFDESFGSWHAYGVEACCRAIVDGGTNTVLPLPVWHDSGSTNLAGLREAHQYVWQKHQRHFRRIYTTCGVLPHRFGWSGSYRVSQLQKQFSNWWHHRDWMKLTKAETAFTERPTIVLEQLTQQFQVIECWHRPWKHAPISAVAMHDRTDAPRTVHHHFQGFQQEVKPETSCLVLMPDLVQDGSSWQLPNKLPEKVLVAIDLNQNRHGPQWWQSKLDRPWLAHLAMEVDDIRWAILELKS